ncbi:MAG TPA: arginine deiminase-related protein [Xanthobacteraceae bacterium]
MTRLLMCEPTAFSADVANNALMAEIPPERRVVDSAKALSQWQVLYRLLNREATVYLLPAGRFDTGLQDQVFVANLGVVIPEANLVVVARFASSARVSEERYGRTFFDDIGYGRVLHSPYAFEGEAEMKRLAPFVYACGYGIRSDFRAYQWMLTQLVGHCDVRFVLLRETDPKLYHLDCSLFPLADNVAMVATGAFSKQELAALEAHIDILDVPVAAAHAGVCNMLRVGKKLFSFARPNSGKDEDRLQVRVVEGVCKRCGYEPVYVDLTEFVKSGADLSCMVMHLNY